MKNKFIVIEALDAGGSQTQTDLLVEHLKRDEYDVLPLHFPQEDRATGRVVYDKFLLNGNEKNFSRREQALIYIQDFYSRSEDISNFMARSNKSVVVSDRFCTSTFAYQTIGLNGAVRNKMLEWLLWLTNQGKTKLPKPGLVALVDTPVAVSLKRMSKKKKDYFENEQKLTAIRDSYLKVAKQQRWAVVSGVDKDGRERTREELHEEIWQKVQGVVVK